jgi:UrcA family protein
MYRTKLCKILAFLALVATACAFLSATAAARNTTVVVKVSARGLDLRQPSDVRTLYGRLRLAAQVVCTHGNRVALEPVPNLQHCYEQALGAAIRSSNLPLLTAIYLETHTLQEAAQRGIEIPEQVAAK